MYNLCLKYTGIFYTDKKENQTFLIYKEIQSGTVAKSNMTLTASSYMEKYFRISSCIRKPFLIYDFATAPLKISLYMRKIWFFFYQCSRPLFPHVKSPPRPSDAILKRFTSPGIMWNLNTSRNNVKYAYVYSMCMRKSETYIFTIMSI